MMDDKRASFTAADVMPVKLLQNANLIKSITEKKIIPPLHVQLIPTNRCNLKCDFCSCAEEDRSKEMTLYQVDDAINQLYELGMQSVTITGGGDPLMYPYFSYMIGILSQKRISIGLVTNGILLTRILPDQLSKIKWCRISHGDDREFSSTYKFQLSLILESVPSVDWAFSYVVSANPKIDQILDLIYFANMMGCTHVRLVADLLHPQDVNMNELKQVLDPFLQRVTMPVIYQARNEPEKGGNCRICYLKPVVTPDLKVYACCGAQYALDPPTKNFPEALCLGTLPEFAKRSKDSLKPFEGGEQCVTCYYGEYNRTLGMLLTDTMHKEFV